MSPSTRDRILAVILTAGLFILLRSLHADVPQTANDKTRTTSDKTVSPFALKDTSGKSVSLNDFKGKKAIVVIFIGTECPINNLYMARLVELYREFAPRHVQFLGINSNWQDSPQEIAEHARKHNLPFPVLRDEQNKVADLFGASRIPEAFVLDSSRVVRYRGRIDDQYGIDYKRAKPGRRDLAEALLEVLDGKHVSRASTQVAGCFISRPLRERKDGPITFSKHVAPILQNKCQECHRPGQIGPMPLLTYDDAAAWGDTIREVLQDGRMPPWYADPRYGKFSNDRSLSPEDRATLLAWIDQGLARGDERDMPPPRQFPRGWKIGTPDVVFTMNQDFEVPARMPPRGVPYKYFEVPTHFAEDRWVERAEAQAGAPEVVHHIIVFIIKEGERFNPNDPQSPVLCGTAPGDMPLILKPGMARYLPRGARLVFQMHYTPNGKAQKDRSRVGIVFAKKRPDKVVTTLPILNPFFRIPPGADSHEVRSAHTFMHETELVGFMPHMHLRGKDFLYQARYPDGTSRILLSVPRFNFNWQSVYRPAEPIHVPAGTTVECIAHFDNSAKNPNNPDPGRTVGWGDQTWQEMMIGWVDLATDYERFWAWKQRQEQKQAESGGKRAIRRDN
jgi:peroxiredoxin